ncbi:CD209 antigen-like protein D [Physella acuta]|uniref:CD209 antigen-like protein D n=1 Tax=Physella acuta TaxID=109671 RepID=UPI0027DCA097|nr:CD209 antigen-like protein D [Physella acuta]
MQLEIRHIVCIAIMMAQLIDAGRETNAESCPGGIARMFSDHCYYTSQTGVTWFQAQQFCTTLGANLATLVSDDEVKFLNSQVQRGMSWIGFYRSSNQTWKWVDGTESNFTRWDKDQGNVENEECALASYSFDNWHDYPCQTSAFPLCKKHKNQTRWKLVERTSGRTTFNVTVPYSNKSSIQDVLMLPNLVLAMFVCFILL